MEFREFPLHDAIGVVICSKIYLSGDNAIPSGKSLEYADITALRNAGYTSISGFKLKPSDIVKNTAVLKVASFVAGENTAYQIDENNNCFIYAEKNGIANINPERVNRFNSCGQEIFLATTLPFTPVSRGQMLASISMIPPAIANDALDNYIKATSGIGSIINISEYRPKKIFFIQSFLPKNNPEYEKNILANITARVESLGCNLAYQARCEHNAKEIDKAILKSLASDAEIIIISGATPSYHQNDLIPQTLFETSCEIQFCFLPNFPGNNAIVANYKKQKTFLILPEGCDKIDYSGVDLLLRKLVANHHINQKEISESGVGGLLLKEVWYPADLSQINNLISASTDGKMLKVAAIILAAGRGARAGGNNKLLHEIGNETIVSMTVNSAIASKASPIIVVTGFEEDLIAKELKDKDVIIINNADYASGISTSIKTGIECLNKNVSGAIVIPADMPLISPSHINKLIDSFDPANKKAICISTAGGIKKNPVLWAKSQFSNVKIIPENSAFHPTLVEHSDYTCEVPFANEQEALDVNTNSDIDFLNKQMEPISLK